MPCLTRSHLCPALATAAFVPGLNPIDSAPSAGLGSPLPHLRFGWAHPCHICSGTEPHLSRDCAHPGNICAGGSVRGLGSTLMRDFRSLFQSVAHKSHISAGDWALSFHKSMGLPRLAAHTCSDAWLGLDPMFSCSFRQVLVHPTVKFRASGPYLLVFARLCDCTHALCAW